MAFQLARISRIRKAMKQRNLDVLYIRGLSNIAWATGFERVFDTESAHALIVTQERAILHSDSRYVEALEREAQNAEITIDARRMSHQAVLAEVVTSLDSDHRLQVGIEDTLMLVEFRSLEKMNAEKQDDAVPLRWVELNRFVEVLREVKDETEIAAMKHAQGITDKAFERILSFMKPGMTERQVQRELDRYMFEEGAEGLAFDTIVATGAHASSPHAIPGDTPLAVGDAVVMDFGARYAGYCSDMTRTVFVGEPTSTLRHAWDTLCAVNEECESLLASGKKACDIHHRAEVMLAEAGYENKMGHSLGHSVGIDIHEAPNLSPLNGNILKEGNVVTVEPGIYIPGKFGMRLEDFGVITSDGFNVFTQTPHKMFIIEKLN